MQKEYIDRVYNLRTKLPSRYMHKFLQEYPEYNDIKGINRIRNVMRYGVEDNEILEKFEKFFCPSLQVKK